MGEGLWDEVRGESVKGGSSGKKRGNGIGTGFYGR